MPIRRRQYPMYSGGHLLHGGAAVRNRHTVRRQCGTWSMRCTAKRCNTSLAICFPPSRQCVHSQLTVFFSCPSICFYSMTMMIFDYHHVDDDDDDVDEDDDDGDLIF